MTFNHKLGMRASECAPDPSEEARYLGQISAAAFALLLVLFITGHATWDVLAKQRQVNPTSIIQKSLQLIEAAQFVALTASLCAIQSNPRYASYMEAALQFEFFNLRVTAPAGIRDLPGFTELVECSAVPIDLIGQARASIGDMFVGNIILVLLILLIVSIIHTLLLLSAPERWRRTLKAHLPFPVPQLLVALIGSQGLVLSSLQILATASTGCKVAGASVLLLLLALFIALACFLARNVRPSNSSRASHSNSVWNDRVTQQPPEMMPTGLVAALRAGTWLTKYQVLFSMYRQNRFGWVTPLVTCLEKLAAAMIISLGVQLSCGFETIAFVMLQLCRLLMLSVLQPHQNRKMLRSQILLFIQFVCFAATGVASKATEAIPTSLFFAISSTVIASVFLMPLFPGVKAAAGMCMQQARAIIATRPGHKTSIAVRKQGQGQENGADDPRTHPDIWEPGVHDTMAGDAEMWTASSIRRLPPDDEEIDREQQAHNSAWVQNAVERDEINALQEPDHTTYGPEANLFVSRRPSSAQSVSTILTKESDLIVDDLASVTEDAEM
jgi:hypothetical protein